MKIIAAILVFAAGIGSIIYVCYFSGDCQTVRGIGSLSTSFLSVKYNDISPALVRIDNFKGCVLSDIIEIHNELNYPTTWTIQYQEPLFNSYLIDVENCNSSNLPDCRDRGIKCSSPPDIQSCITLPEQVVIDGSEKITIPIGIDIPDDFLLPEVWEFWVRFANVDQGSNVQNAYYQIWQIVS